MNDFFTPRVQAEILEVEEYMQQKFALSNYKLKDNYIKILKAGGKRIRPAFVFLSGEIFGKNKEDLLKFASAIETVHMSTLIHDDIIDHASQRRGQPTLNSRYGNSWALYAGNYLFAEALEMIDPEDNRDIARIMADSAVRIVEGELLQQQALFDTGQTVRDYLRRIRGKTALLLALSCQVGAMVSSSDYEDIQNMYLYGYNLGMAFQIIDDLLDIQDDSRTNKTKGEDLLNGNINLPAILVLKDRDGSSRELKKLIDSRFSGQKNDLERAIELIKEKNGVVRAKEIACRYSEKAKLYLKRLPDNPVKKELIKITDSLYERNF